MADSGDHLSDLERDQLVLQPAVEAVHAYAESSEPAKRQLAEVRINTAEMVVEVGWVGGILDPVTAAAFAHITAETGIDLKIVPRRFSDEDLQTVMAEIIRTQEGVQSAVASDDVIVVTVNSGASPAGRPSRAAPPRTRGVEIPITYKQEDVDPL